jgi:putative ATP-binding cassette transporter
MRLAENSIYKALVAHVNKANGAIVSIAHKPSVAAFHGRRWLLEKRPEDELARFRLSSQRM